MSNFNLKQLRVFIEVVEMKSFTKAAKKLYLSQSTVSNHIQTLEDELGVVLFRREAKEHPVHHRGQAGLSICQGHHFAL